MHGYEWLEKGNMNQGNHDGLFGEQVYSRLEGTYDPNVDFKVEQLGKETRNFMRIRSMRSVPFDSELHLLKVAENLEVSLEK